MSKQQGGQGNDLLGKLVKKIREAATTGDKDQLNHRYDRAVARCGSKALVDERLDDRLRERIAKLHNQRRRNGNATR